MAKVRAKDTTPEILVRKLIRDLGYLGYRTHYVKLRGKPDVVFLRRKKVIFVHGCFWHGHSCRAGKNVPRTNLDYWIPKLERNKRRDRINIRAIRRSGWQVLTIWECQLKNEQLILKKLERLLCV